MRESAEAAYAPTELDSLGRWNKVQSVGVDRRMRMGARAMMSLLGVLFGLAPFGLAVLVSIPLWIWVFRILRPRYLFGRPSRSLVWLERLRTLGLFGVIAAYMFYLGVTTDVASRAALGPVQDGMRSLPAILLAMVVVVLAARGGHRGRAVAALRRPLGAVFLLVVFAAAVIVLVNTVDGPPVAEEPPEEDEVGWATVMWLLKAGSWLAFGLSFGALTILVSFLAVRHWCSAADGHPMLPAVTTILYAAMNVGWYLYDGATPGVPVLVDRLIALGGPAMLLVIALVELRILRVQGVSLSGPPPRVGPAPRADRREVLPSA
jgi:hypothetical protein